MRYLNTSALTVRRSLVTCALHPTINPPANHTDLSNSKSIQGDLRFGKRVHKKGPKHIWRLGMCNMIPGGEGGRREGRGEKGGEGGEGREGGLRQAL